MRATKRRETLPFCLFQLAVLKDVLCLCKFVIGLQNTCVVDFWATIVVVCFGYNCEWMTRVLLMEALWVYGLSQVVVFSKM